METLEIKTFEEALKELSIEDYSEKIFSSNSHGELLHLMDYIDMANQLGASQKKNFRKEFLQIVEWAEKNWKRPQSVYQHVMRILAENGW